MPAPARTSRDAILAAASTILEEEGLEGLTMARVAARVGIRPPSLYKHVPDRAHLVRAVGEVVLGELQAMLEGAIGSDEPASDIRSIATAFRAHVHRRPNGYALLFTNLAPEYRPDPALAARVGTPIVGAMAPLVGRERALEAARTLVAWAHGFVSMELAGAFRLGGDVDAAYAFGVETLVAGLSAVASRP